MATEPPVVATVIKRRDRAPWYVWVAVVAIIAGAVSLGARGERDEAKPVTQQVTPEMREVAKNLVAGYTANGVISGVTPSQASVSLDWYALDFENKRRCAGALITRYGAKSYKFVDLHSGKTVAEYDSLWGFRVK